jgi:SAM-dependent methyltransferase
MDARESLHRLARGSAQRIATLIAREGDKRLRSEFDALSKSVARNSAYSARLIEDLRHSSAKDPFDFFEGSTDDYWLWVNTIGVRYFPELETLLPTMPPEFNQLASASGVGDDTLTEGFKIYALFRDLAAAHGRPVDACDAILDFGCGWGRVLRFFLRDVPGDKLWGVDMWSDQIHWAGQTNPWSQFMVVDKSPPTELAADSFDVVVAFSVFSHISESVHEQWLSEFRRILKPGGLAIVTTWGRERANDFDAVMKQQEQSWDQWYNQSMHRFFPGKEAWLREYDAGGYCHVDLRYEGDTDYGETCIPKAYVLRE